MEGRLPLQGKANEISRTREISRLRVEDILDLKEKEEQNTPPQKDDTLKLPSPQTSQRKSLFRMRAQSSQLPRDDGRSPEKKQSDSHAESKERNLSFIIKATSGKNSPSKPKDGKSNSLIAGTRRSHMERNVANRSESISISDRVDFLSPSRDSHSSQHRISFSKKSNVASPESNSRSAKAPLNTHLENKEQSEENIGTMNNHGIASSRAGSLYSTWKNSSKQQNLKLAAGKKCALYSCPEARTGVAYCSEHLSIESFDVLQDPSNLNEKNKAINALIEDFAAFLNQKSHTELSNYFKIALESDHVDASLNFSSKFAEESYISDVSFTCSRKEGGLLGYEILENSASGKLADLSRNGGKSVHLGFKRSYESASSFVTSLCICFEGKDEEIPMGFTKVLSSSLPEENTGASNIGTTKAEVSLSYRKSLGFPISDIALIYPRYKEVAPTGFHTILFTPSYRHANINFGSENPDAYVCVKYSYKDIALKMQSFYEKCLGDEKKTCSLLALLLEALFIPDAEVVEKCLGVMRILFVQMQLSLMEECYNFLIAILSEFQVVVMVTMGNEILHSNSLLIRDLFNLRISSIDTKTAILVYSTCFLCRKIDKQESVLLGFLYFILSKLKEASKNDMQGFQDALFSLEDSRHFISRVVMNPIIEFISKSKFSENLFQCFYRCKTISEDFAIQCSKLVDNLFENQFNRLLQALFIVSSKVMAMSGSIRTTSVPLESMKRRYLAIHCIATIFENEDFYMNPALSSALILRRCFFTSLMESFVTFVPEFTRNLFNLLEIVYLKYRNHCKMEIGFVFDLIVSILQHRFCIFEQKYELICGLTKFFRISDFTIDFFYNYDNRFYQYPLLSQIFSVLASFSRGDSMNLLESSDSILQISALNSLITILEYYSKFILQKSDGVFTFGITNRSMKNVKQNQDKATALKRRVSTWKLRQLDQKTISDFFERAVEISKKQSLKDAVKYLWNEKIPNMSTYELAKWLKNSDTLDKSNIGDFLGSDFNKDFSSEFFVDLRSSYLHLFDFSRMTFDQALRMFLVHSGFRLPGEAQKIDRLLEAFADAYCRDNPGVFPSSESAFVISFSLIMLNTDLHDPRLVSGKRARPPMSFDDFCRNLRGTSGANELSADLLLFLYNSVKKTPIEWKSNKVDLSLKNMSPDERARICDLEFVQECDMYLSQAFGHIRDESVYRKSYLNSNSANIASCIFDLFWPQALSAFSVASQSKSSKILSYCLDGLKYVLSSAVLLCRPNEIDSFLPILAKISFSYGYTGTNEDLQRSLIKGAHLEQEWLSDLMDMCMNNPKAACKKINYIATDYRKKLLFDREQKLLKELEFKFGEEILLADTNRKFIREGELRKIARTGKAREYRFFLFNNVLLYASPGSANQRKYKIHRCIFLGLSRILDIQDRIDVSPPILNAFILKNPQKEITIMCGSIDEKNSWMDSISKSIESTIDQQKKRLEDAEAGFFEPSVSKSASPVKDVQVQVKTNFLKSFDQVILQILGEAHDSPKCRLCLKAFGRFSSRKYSCPSCKNSVCSDCSSRTAEAYSGTSSEPQTVKICDACYGIISGSVSIDEPILTLE